MAAKANEINIRTIAINAAISAVATAATLYILNRSGIFKTKGVSSGMAGVGKAFLLLPNHVLARFASQEIMQNANNPKWLIEQFGNLDLDTIDFNNGTDKVTAANFAYLSLYANHHEIRKKSGQIIQQMKSSVL